MEFNKCLKRLLIKEPFYGLFCMQLPKVIDEKIDTLCVQRKGLNTEIHINPKFWDSLSDDEQLGVLKHELLHICFNHIFMFDSFPNHNLFNIAADMEVNSYIDKLPDGAILAKDFGLEPKKGTKYYYEKLKDKFPNNSNNSGGKGDKDNGSGDMPQTFDNHDWEDFKNADNATKQLMQNKVNRLVSETANKVQKSRGNIPGEIQDVLDRITIKPPVFNWKQYFRRVLGTIYDIELKTTRRKPSKRFEGASGIKHKKKASILVAIDTSASVSNDELKDFFSEIHHVWKTGSKVTICECDTQIGRIYEYKGNHDNIKVTGRGGTDFNPPMDYYCQNKHDFSSLIYFTDGECHLPDRRPNNVIWVITPTGYHQEYFGKVIYIPNCN
jgi:Uncharacterized protein conserved in bacteria